MEGLIFGILRYICIIFETKKDHRFHRTNTGTKTTRCKEEWVLAFGAMISGIVLVGKRLL